MKKKKIFLICPVARVTPKQLKQITRHIRQRERDGYKVHWPYRDTNQDDLSGGFEICRRNFAEIMRAEIIDIWYDETSGGSKFDMGGVFMLAMLGHEKKVNIVNEKSAAQADKKNKKSFLRVMKKYQAVAAEPKLSPDLSILKKALEKYLGEKEDNCGLAALIIQDYYGGIIINDSLWHYKNKLVNGLEIDLSEGHFHDQGKIWDIPLQEREARRDWILGNFKTAADYSKLKDKIDKYIMNA